MASLVSGAVTGMQTRAPAHLRRWAAPAPGRCRALSLPGTPWRALTTRRLASPIATGRLDPPSARRRPFRGGAPAGPLWIGRLGGGPGGLRALHGTPAHLKDAKDPKGSPPRGPKPPESATEDPLSDEAVPDANPADADADARDSSKAQGPVDPMAAEPVDPADTDPPRPAAASHGRKKKALRAKDPADHGEAEPSVVVAQGGAGGEPSSEGRVATSKGYKKGGSGSSNGPGSNLEKINIPKDYPQLLAIPLARRPLFPGFYKSLYIKDPQVIAAIHNRLENRQPYVGIFLAKDDEFDGDTVSDLNQVHRVGVFSQITNVYASGPGNESLTVVVYPYRRVRIQGLIPPPQNLVSSVPEPASAKEADTEPDALVKTKSEPEPHVIVKTPTKGSDLDPAPTPLAITTRPDTTVTDPLAPYDPINLELSKYGATLVNVENLDDQPFNSDNPLIKALTSEMLNVLKEISYINGFLRDSIISFSIQTGGNSFQDPAKLADFAAAVSAGEPGELQSVLESLVVEERLQKSLIILKKELANAKLQQEISKEVDKKITRKQQEYFLMEQLKGIKKELGMDSDGKDKLVDMFKERAKELKMPELVKKVFEEELNKLQHLEAAASEFNVTRNYLDWLTQIPWGKKSNENFNIKHAISVLDEDHYGLKDVKDRILEFIAVGKLRGTVEGKIICLVGPPGVGKTSVGKSIARALSREFYRFSVGGLSDVAEIKGHRRTYIGAMPGKVIQALKKVATENPLILIDEIDKLGRGHQGDPASALLELLDPEQNSSFLDHYMDVPIDLSKVLFVCTANVLDTIPGPLLDRMEVITLSGYVAEEKKAIAKQYLTPQAKTSAGLDSRDIAINDDALDTLIRNYCRESGVRNLKKHIDKVFRKAAYKIVVDQEDDLASASPAPAASAPDTPPSATTTPSDSDSSSTPAPPSKSSSAAPTSIAPAGLTDDASPAPPPAPPAKAINITTENLKDYVGSPLYTSDRMYETTPAGVVMGLAWTSMGGSALYIESVLESTLDRDSKPALSRTGQMGDVMKESSTIAYTYSKALLLRRFPGRKFFERAGIHMHVPEGATPKDGPSAGVTMTTSLLSLALNQPIHANIAMTGELTLTGKVLKIGGVKEKTIAAKRCGVTQILFPAANASDWAELPDYVKDGMQAHFVEWYDEIFERVFDLAAVPAAEAWFAAPPPPSPPSAST